MKKALAVTPFVLLLVSAAAAAGDESSLRFSTAVDLNFKRVTIEAAGGTVTNTFKPNFRTLSVSPTLSYGGFFASVAVERSLGDASTAGTINNGTAWSDKRYSREENYATVGYNVWEGLNVFAGYLDNTTINNTDTIGIGGGGVSVSRSETTDRGPFFGLGYTQRFTEGALTASAAATRAKGSSDVTNITNPGVLTETIADGHTTGASYSLAWSAPLSGSLYFRLGYKATRYQFKFNANGVDQTNTRNYDAVFIGVANHF
jgi:hypothetical protein